MMHFNVAAMTYLEKLRHIRRLLYMNQTQFAKELGVTQCSVSQYERGDVYPSQRARKKYIELAKKFKVPLKLAELIGD